MVYRAVVSRPNIVQAPTVQVVSAVHQLDIGALLTDKDLQFVQWTGAVPQGMVQKKDSLIGRGVISTIYAGEPVLENRLAEPGGGAGLAATIPPGMRAVAVRVNDVTAVAGFAIPGSRVDILISGVPPGGGAGGPVVKTLLQNVQILSAGQNYQKDAEGKPVLVPVVNLLVTPAQAETMSLASNETRIQLILRNPLDTEQSKTNGTMVSNLYGPNRPIGPVAAPAPAPKAPVPPPAPVAEKPAPPPVFVPPPPIQVEILNGGSRSEASFPRKTEDIKK
jgi:pilus assembly protein CpaB